MAKVLITGGTGLIGKYLCERLHERGYEVSVLSRKPNDGAKFRSYYWDLDKNEIDAEAIQTADFIIHLAGVNIGERRWSTERKQLIVDSRIKSGELILNHLPKQNSRMQAFITASGVGYYGAITSGQIFSEDEPSGNDFLGQTCEKWEQIADRFSAMGIRTVKIRTAVVLAKQAGALSKMIVPIKMGIGSAIGSGKQYLPWIHIDDLCNMYIKAVEDPNMSGAYNAVSPDQVTNNQFTKIAAKVLKRPFWFPNIPSWVIQMVFGQMSVLLLTGSRVSAEKIIHSGFVFKFPKLEDALIDCLS